MTLRHDAQQCRAKARSEVIRLSLGILTPEERQAKEAAEIRRQQDRERKTALGTPLFLEDIDV